MHIINDDSAFNFNKKRDANPNEIVFAGGQAMSIHVWGEVTLTVRTPNGRKPIILTHVAYVKGFFASVLRLSRCREIGIHFDSGRNLLYQNRLNNAIVYLEYNKGHWLIDDDENRRPDLKQHVTMAAQTGRIHPSRSSRDPKPALQVTPMEAHYIWAHPGQDTIAHLPDAITGLQLKAGEAAPAWGNCQPCVETKMSQKIARRSQEHPATRPFEQIAIDLIQFVPTGESCYNGDKWALHGMSVQ